MTVTGINNLVALNVDFNSIEAGDTVYSLARHNRGSGWELVTSQGSLVCAYDDDGNRCVGQVVAFNRDNGLFTIRLEMAQYYRAEMEQPGIGFVSAVPEPYFAHREPFQVA
jgi:hypothetical protein